MGVDFWEDRVKTVDIVTSNKNAAVVVRETSTEFEVAVTDPTQSNTGDINIEIAMSASGVVPNDSAIFVEQLGPTKMERMGNC